MPEDKKIMTYDEYISNPLGKHNAVFGNRDMYKRLYTEKWDKLLVREAGKINFRVLKDSKTGKYYVYINIPSEVVPKFYYDTVVEFYPNGPSSIGTSLKDYGIRFYSNDPSFVFTYLRVFLKNDMFIEELNSKSPRLAVKQDPVEKNPQQIIGYVKSIYFAYLLMKQKNLFNKLVLDTMSEKFSVSRLQSLVKDADIVIAERQRLGELEQKKKQKEKASKINSLEKARGEALKTRPSNGDPNLRPKTSNIITSSKKSSIVRKSNIIGKK